jgi:hypothetical protein
MSRRGFVLITMPAYVAIKLFFFSSVFTMVINLNVHRWRWHQGWQIFQRNQLNLRLMSIRNKVW